MPKISVGDKVSYILDGHKLVGYVLRKARRDPKKFEVSDTYSPNGQVYVLAPTDLTKIEDYEKQVKP